MKYIFTLVFFICSQWLFAQKTAMTPAVHQALNNYTTFTNECIHALWMLHTDFQDFNNQCNDYRAEKRTTLSFDNRKILDNSSYYKVLPNTLKKKALKDSKALSTKHQQALNGLLEELWFSMLELKKIQETLQSYVDKKRYGGDFNLSKAYKQLERAAIFFNDVKSLRDRLSWKLDEVASTYLPPSLRDPHVRSARDFKRLFKSAERLLIDLKKNNDEGVKLRKQQMERIIAQIEKNQPTNLKGLTRLPKGNGTCPYQNYETTLRIARSFVAHAETYLTSDAAAHQYEEVGKNYYYYNKHLLNKYNRYGNGFAPAFNKLIALSDKHLLLELEEPHWFKVTYPNDLNKENPISSFRDTSMAQQTKPKPKPKPVPKVGDPTLEGFAPNNLIFLLDVSSSMNTPEKLPLLKKSLQYLLSLMRPQDNISIVAYSGNARIVLSPTSASEKGKIISALNNINPSGRSNAKEGFKLAYKVANKGFIPEGNNRIIIATDGKFDISKKINRMVEKNAEKDILLSVFYFGRKENPTAKTELTSLASLGLGKYSYIQAHNSKITLLKEAQRVRKK